MERLEKDSPVVSLTEEQKAELAELDSIYQAKMAEKEIFIEGQLANAVESGDMEAVASLERQKSADRNNLQAELKRKKEAVRGGN